MRHFALFLALIPAIMILAYVLLSPAYLGDYRWIIIALPVSLAVARELYDHTKGTSAKGPHHIVQVALEPLDDCAETEDDAETNANADSVVGLWTGTVTIWPGKPDEVLQVLPLQLAITDEGRKVSAILPDYFPSDARIIETHLLEYEPRTGHLDVKLVLEQDGRRRDLETKLTLTRNRLVPGDDTEDVTVELQRAVPAAVIA